MMERRYIAPFTDSEQGVMFSGATVYTADGETFAIFEKRGHIILVPKTVIALLEAGKVHPDYKRKLLSRGFLANTSGAAPIISDACKNICAVMPEFFMIDLTKQCNMRCKYCLREISGGEQASISDDVLEAVCQFITRYCDAHRLKDVSIQAWGGEPLLELGKILRMRTLIRPRRTKVHFSIETNALLLTADTLQKLYDSRIGIGISIDGTAHLHDLQRVSPNGAGTHVVVEKHLLMAMELYGAKIGTITTVTRNNAPYVEEILEYFATELHLKNVKFNYIHQSMFNPCSDLCLKKEEIAATELRILNKLISLIERGYPIFESNLKIKLNNLLYHKYSDICHSRGCSGGLKMIVIGLDGQIYPCELTDSPGEAIGDIYNHLDLPELVWDALGHKDFFTVKTSAECEKCEWYVFCAGGCTVRTISSGNRPPAIDEIECAVNQTVYPALVELTLTKPQIVDAILGE